MCKQPEVKQERTNGTVVKFESNGGKYHEIRRIRYDRN
jgi:hypothetical protein